MRPLPIPLNRALLWVVNSGRIRTDVGALQGVSFASSCTAFVLSLFLKQKRLEV